MRDVIRKSIGIKEEYRLEVEKQPMKYDEALYQEKDPVYFQGFWQPPNYFDEFYDEIKQQFMLNRPFSSRADIYMRQMEAGNSVSLHIRRIGYDRDVNNVCLEEDFCREAICRMKQSVGEF